MPIWEYTKVMARLATTSDAFSAVAEPWRRAIIDLLAKRGALAVGTIVAALGLSQPSVSKHLGVLREVGLVSVERMGQQRVYRLQPEGLRTMYDWLKMFEAMWSHQLDRVKARAERMQRAAEARNSTREA